MKKSEGKKKKNKSATIFIFKKLLKRKTPGMNPTQQ